MIRRLKEWIKDESGATAIEYGLIASAVALTVSAAIFLLGGSLDDLFYTQLANALTGG